MKRLLPFRLAWAIVLLLAGTAPTAAQEKPQAFVGARIVPIAGAEIPDGVLIVHRGKIVRVGSRASTPVPRGAERHDIAGKLIMPGLVDTHSHIGGARAGRPSAPIQPDVSVFDSINPRDTGLQRAQAGGITTVNVMPGSGHLLSGQTVYLKLRDATTIEELVVRDPDGRIAGGHEDGQRHQLDPAARRSPAPAKSAALVREQFVKAHEYRDKVRQAAGDHDEAAGP